MTAFIVGNLDVKWQANFCRSAAYLSRLFLVSQPHQKNKKRKIQCNETPLIKQDIRLNYKNMTECNQYHIKYQVSSKVLRIKPKKECSSGKLPLEGSKYPCSGNQLNTWEIYLQRKVVPAGQLTLIKKKKKKKTTLFLFSTSPRSHIAAVVNTSSSFLAGGWLCYILDMKSHSINDKF